MTAPKENSEENGVDLVGGETGINEQVLKMANRIQATE